MGAKLEVVVGGRWLSMDTFLGDVKMSTVYPGGSDEVTWTPVNLNDFRFQGRQRVDVYYGGVPVWAGKMVEPDASQEDITATGAWRDGDNYVALDSGGNATKIPDTAVARAIIRGLDWTQTALSTSNITQDISQGPVRVSAILDAYADANGVKWGVDTRRTLVTQSDPTTPIYQTLPIAGGLGMAFDNYASTLYGRHLNGSGTAYLTETATDGVAELAYDRVEDVLDFVSLGAMGATEAQNRLATIIGPNGRSTPQWTQSIDLVYGELLTMGGVPVALETVTAGTMIRVNGGYELMQRVNGNMYVDIIIGRTELDAGTLTITPLNVAARTLSDALS